MRVVIHRGTVSMADFCDRGSVYEVCSEDFLYLFFSFYFRYIIFCTSVLWPLSDSKPCTYVDIYIEVVITFFHLSLHVLFLFSLYAHASYIIYAILYFCFTLRCLDEFCLKCFRNTGCQSLLTINSLLAKFFKSLCYNRFYCIQQMSMSWVIYDFSLCSFVYCSFVTDCQRGRLLGHMWFDVRNICQFKID